MVTTKGCIVYFLESQLKVGVNFFFTLVTEPLYSPLSLLFREIKGQPKSGAMVLAELLTTQHLTV